MENQPRPRRSIAIRWELIAWVGTAVMLVTYAMLSAKVLNPGVTFFACQLAGQVSLAIVSASKRAWQPAFANFAFAAASIIGLTRIYV